MGSFRRRLLIWAGRGLRANLLHYGKAILSERFFPRSPRLRGGGGKRNYKGETNFLIIPANVPPVFLYLACFFYFFSEDAFRRFFRWKVRDGVGTLVLLVNIILLTMYTLSVIRCGTWRCGTVDCFSCANFLESRGTSVRG